MPETKEIEWPTIPRRKMLYTALMFPLATSAMLYGEAEIHFSSLTQAFLCCVHIVIILIISRVVARNTEKKILALDTPLLWRYLLTLTYGATPFTFNTVVYIFAVQKIPSAFSIYSGGLLCIFGGITAILMTKEIPEVPVSRDYLEKVYEETLQLVWPYTFSFVLMLTASPFVAIQLQGVTDLGSLSRVVFVGMIGFVTLIVMPLSNLSDIRREMYKQK